MKTPLRSDVLLIGISDAVRLSSDAGRGQKYYGRETAPGSGGGSNARKDPFKKGRKEGSFRRPLVRRRWSEFFKGVAREGWGSFDIEWAQKLKGG